MRVITLIVSLAIIQFLSLIFNVVIIRLQTCLMMTRLSPSRNDRRKTLEIYTGNSPSPSPTLTLTHPHPHPQCMISIRFTFETFSRMKHMQWRVFSTL